jgi:hypothetical protein
MTLLYKYAVNFDDYANSKRNTSPFEDPIRIWIGRDATLEETCHCIEYSAPQNVAIICCVVAH